MRISTINQTAKELGLPPFMLRTMLAKGKLPGFYAGTRFYVNVDLLEEKLLQASLAAMSGSAEKSC